jgi:hypothetical protein
MRRLLVLSLFAIFAIPLWAQDSSEPKTEAAETPVAENDAADDDSSEQDIEDEQESDELYSEEDEDKFIPSEDVAFGQSIPFPTDI